MKRSSHAWRLCDERLVERGVPEEDMEDKERFKPRFEGVRMLVFSSHGLPAAAAVASAFLRCQRVILEETAGIEKLMADSNCTCDSIVDGFIVVVVCCCLLLFLYD
jgi:hypothetical protein